MLGTKHVYIDFRNRFIIEIESPVSSRNITLRLGDIPCLNLGIRRRPSLYSVSRSQTPPPNLNARGGEGLAEVLAFPRLFSGEEKEPGIYTLYAHARN